MHELRSRVQHPHSPPVATELLTVTCFPFRTNVAFSFAETFSQHPHWVVVVVLQALLSFSCRLVVGPHTLPTSFCSYYVAECPRQINRSSYYALLMTTILSWHLRKLNKYISTSDTMWLSCFLWWYAHFQADGPHVLCISFRMVVPEEHSEDVKGGWRPWRWCQFHLL